MHLLQAGVNLIYIKDILGHADMSTTEIYLRADTKNEKRRVRETGFSDHTIYSTLMVNGWRFNRMA